MKQFILYLFILLPFCVNSQVNETFDGPMLGADWIGKDRGQFAVNADGRLQLNIEPTESGTAPSAKKSPIRPICNGSLMCICRSLQVTRINYMFTCTKRMTNAFVMCI